MTTSTHLHLDDPTRNENLTAADEMTCVTEIHHAIGNPAQETDTPTEKKATDLTGVTDAETMIAMTIAGAVAVEEEAAAAAMRLTRATDAPTATDAVATEIETTVTENEIETVTGVVTVTEIEEVTATETAVGTTPIAIEIEIEIGTAATETAIGTGTAMIVATETEEGTRRRAFPSTMSMIWLKWGRSTTRPWRRSSAVLARCTSTRNKPTG